MTRYNALALTTKYWKSGTTYLDEIVSAVNRKVADGDFVVVSEKALSTAQNNIVDKNALKPSFAAKLLATHWMPVAWGLFLGVCSFEKRLLRRVREYPAENGGRNCS